VKRIETVRLYPTAAQSAALEHILHVTRHLYNAALQERRDAYRLRKVTLWGSNQGRELTALRRESIHVADVYRETEDAVLRRLDKAYAAFFRRCKTGEKPGFPRYKSFSRWRQIEYPHGDRACILSEDQCKVRVPAAGWIKLRKGRLVPPFKRAWLVCKRERWYAQFECERVINPLPSTGRVVGVDRGVTVLIATSDEQLIDNPRYLAAASLKLKRAQRVVAKRKRGGRNRRKAVKTLARLHEKVKLQRRDYAHKVSRRLVNAYDGIALEDLHLINMTKSAKGKPKAPGRGVAAKAGLNRVLLDAGFGQLAHLIAEKAECAARVMCHVIPHYSSQECARCGFTASENRRGLTFACTRCGQTAHADVNAARVILGRAQWEPLASRATLVDGNDPETALAPSGPRLTQHDAA
jgi:putative transposase